MILLACQSISAPPAKEKNDRKKEVAAKAMERPNTIWISRRRPAAHVAERQAQAGDDDDDDGDHLGDRTLDGLQDALQRRLPWHARAGGVGGIGDDHGKRGRRPIPRRWRAARSAAWEWGSSGICSITPCASVGRPSGLRT